VVVVGEEEEEEAEAWPTAASPVGAPSSHKKASEGREGMVRMGPSSPDGRIERLTGCKVQFVLLSRQR